MPVNKGRTFAERDVFVDYPFEQVMYRWDHLEKKIYVKFYDEDEKADPIPHSSKLFNDALLYGDEIDEIQYKSKGLQNAPKIVLD